MFLKRTLISLIITLIYLSVTNLKLDLPLPIKKALLKRTDRLIDFSIDLYDIEIHYNAVKEDFPAK